MANIVIMPKQGLQMTEGLITKWLKKVGDEVKEGEPLFEMETDKLTITIDSSFSGTLLKIIRDEGEEVPITEPIAVIGEPGEDISGAVAGQAIPEATASDTQTAQNSAPAVPSDVNVVIMPKQGLQMTEGLITKWLKKVGDEVKEGEPLFEMETDKLTITIDSSFSGTLLKIIRDEGEEVPITEPIALIGKPGDDVSGIAFEAASKPEASAALTPEPVHVAEKPAALPKTAPLPVVSPKSSNSNGRVFITPRAKMRCAERGITDYSKIPGSGGDGLIIERDVLAYKETKQTASERIVSRITIRSNIGAAERYVKSAAESGLEFSMDKLIKKAAVSAAKRYETFDGIEIKTLCDTEAEEYFPALSPNSDILLSAGGIYTEGDRRVTVLSIGFDQEKTEAVSVADYLSHLKNLLENPLLMMAI